MPFGNFGDVSSSSRYIATQHIREHPNIKRIVGDSFGGSVAL